MFSSITDFDRKKILLMVILLFAAALFSARFIWFPEIKAEAPMERGTLELADWDRTGAFSMTGDWHFFWRHFLTGSELHGDIKPDLLAHAPDIWNNYTVDGEKLPAKGYATYQLEVTGAEPGEILAMRISPASTALRVIVENDVVYRVGKVSVSPLNSEPAFSMNAFSFTAPSRNFHLIIQVSNYEYARGGLWEALCFGSVETVYHLDDLILARDLFLVGFFSVMALITLCLYILRRERTLLLFIILCILLILRTMVYGSFSIQVLFPFVSFSASVRLAYQTMCWIPCICFLLLRENFPDEITQRVARAVLVYTIVMSFSLTTLPFYYMTKSAYFHELASLVIALFGLYHLIRAFVARRQGSISLFTGVLLMIFCGFRDTMYQNRMLDNVYMEYLPFGFLLMTLIWGGALAIRYDEAIRERELAMKETYLLLQREQQLELRYLKSQIRPHFIHNALNAIVSVSRTDYDRARMLLVEFSKYLRNCYDNTFHDLIPFENELSFVRSYMTLEQARYEERLEVDYNIDSFELNIPPLILQPLAENAVIHGIRKKTEGGKVVIYALDQGDFIKLGVRDNGVGIEPERFAQLLHSSSESTGAGIAISNIESRLRKLYGTGLNLTTPTSGGADISMLIPKQLP